MEPRLVPELRVYRDLPSASNALARHLSTCAARSVEARGRFSLVLSGGSTPAALYRHLAKEYRNRLPWGKTEVFFGDERCVSPRAPESNYRMAREELLSHLPVGRRQIHRLRGEVRPPYAEAQRYAHVIGGNGSTIPTNTSPPRFDMVLLGIGADGHTASLFPGNKALRERRRWLVYVPRPGQAPLVPRLTMTFPALASSREVCFLVSGQEKAAAVSRIFRSFPRGSPQLPASLVRSMGPTRWFIDRKAALHLPEALQPHATAARR